MIEKHEEEEILERENSQLNLCRVGTIGCTLGR